MIRTGNTFTHAKPILDDAGAIAGYIIDRTPQEPPVTDMTVPASRPQRLAVRALLDGRTPPVPAEESEKFRRDILARLDAGDVTAAEAAELIAALRAQPPATPLLDEAGAPTFTEGGRGRQGAEGAVPCRVCGRPLTDPESRELGVGPVCATRR